MNFVRIGHIIVNLDCAEPRAGGKLGMAARRCDLTQAELRALMERLPSSPGPLSLHPSSAWSGRDRPPML
jgi:hypothetical protein